MAGIEILLRLSPKFGGCYKPVTACRLIGSLWLYGHVLIQALAVNFKGAIDPALSRICTDSRSAIQPFFTRTSATD